jgi:hypothetical protein
MYYERASIAHKRFVIFIGEILPIIKGCTVIGFPTHLLVKCCPSVHLTLGQRGILWSLSLEKDFSQNASIHKAQHQQNIESVMFHFVRVWKVSQDFWQTASALELGLGNLTEKTKQSLTVSVIKKRQGLHKLAKY